MKYSKEYIITAFDKQIDRLNLINGRDFCADRMVRAVFNEAMKKGYYVDIEEVWEYFEFLVRRGMIITFFDMYAHESKIYENERQWASLGRTTIDAVTWIHNNIRKIIS